MTRKGLGLAWVLLAVMACDKGPPAAATPRPAAAAHGDGAEGLKVLLGEILKASESGDAKQAAALTRGLMPDGAALKKALRDDAPAEFVDQAQSFGKGVVTAADAEVAGLIKRGDPARTEIKVYAATTEEIAAYQQGSVAYSEFPGGARKLAGSLLRPGVTFYEAELTVPGQDSGMKYHLFFWDGAAWKMLGPVWRFAK